MDVPSVCGCHCYVLICCKCWLVANNKVITYNNCWLVVNNKFMSCRECWLVAYSKLTSCSKILDCCMWRSDFIYNMLSSDRRKVWDIVGKLSESLRHCRGRSMKKDNYDFFIEILYYKNQENWFYIVIFLFNFIFKLFCIFLIWFYPWFF